MVKKYLKTGTDLIGTAVITGAIPNISGTTTEATLKSNFATGLGNMGKVFPVYGAVTGTKMVIKPIKTMKKASSKLFKGGKKL